jgi:hypothetical protein
VGETGRDAGVVGSGANSDRPDDEEDDEKDPGDGSTAHDWIVAPLLRADRPVGRASA